MGKRYMGSHPIHSRVGGTGVHGKYVKIFGIDAVKGADYKANTDGPAVWIALDNIEEYFKIKEGAKTNYHYLNVYNAIRSLNNKSCDFDAEFNSVNIRDRCLNVTGAYILYDVCDGDAYIQNLRVKSLSFIEDMEKRCAPGLYNAVKVPSEKYWDAEVDVNKEDSSSLATGYDGVINIGVSGHADNVLVAANIMPFHFHKVSSSTGESLIFDLYNLLYLPNENGMDNGWNRIMEDCVNNDISAKQTIKNLMASIIQSQANSKVRVNWVVQGEAAEYFAGGLDAFQANAALTHIEQRQTVKKQEKEALVDKMAPSLSPQARGGFSNHYVYFSNPTGGLSGIESKLEKLGMQQLSPGVWHESNPYLIAAGITGR